MIAERYETPLSAEVWYEIAGRGWVAVIPERVWQPPLRAGMTVGIDGVDYSVRGIERHAVFYQPESSYKIGILVGERKAGQA